MLRTWEVPNYIHLCGTEDSCRGLRSSQVRSPASSACCPLLLHSSAHPALQWRAPLCSPAETGGLLRQTTGPSHLGQTGPVRLCPLTRLGEWLVGLHHASCIAVLVHFEVQSQRNAMPKNAQTMAQLHSSHTLASNAQNSPSQASTVHEPWTSRCSSWI